MNEATNGPRPKGPSRSKLVIFCFSQSPLESNCPTLPHQLSLHRYRSMARSTALYLLCTGVLLLSQLGIALAHEHGEEISEEEANAPVDSILWLHMFAQAAVWGIIFPVGMVLGLSRSRYHVPLQVSISPLSWDFLFILEDRAQVMHSLSRATFWATHIRAVHSPLPRTAVLRISCSFLSSCNFV